MALNERRRRGISVAPGVSPGTASSFPYQARFSGRQSQYGGNKRYLLANARGSVCRPSGALIIFAAGTPGLRPGLLICRPLCGLVDWLRFC